MFSADPLDTVRAVPGGQENPWPAAALRASLSSAPVSLTCVALSNPVQPPPGIQDGRTKESIGGTTSQKETLILFIACGQTAGALEMQSFAVVFVVSRHFPPGTPLG